jgi:thioredoxin 1
VTGTEWERLIVLGQVVAGMGGVVLAVRVLLVWSRRRLLEKPVHDLWSALGEEADERLTVVAFHSPSCGACHAVQAPVLRLLQQQLGRLTLRLVEVDVAARPSTARAFGVITVPSTVLLERGGIVDINHGFCATERLVKQVEQAMRARQQPRETGRH